MNERSSRLHCWRALMAEKMSRHARPKGAASPASQLPRQRAPASASVGTARLPAGYRPGVAPPWGQEIGDDLTVGFNHDWVGYYPIDLLEKGADRTRGYAGFLPVSAATSDGLLVINHEYVNTFFVGSHRDGVKTAAQIAAEQETVGLSILRVQKDEQGSWSVLTDAPEARRIHARTPCLLTGPAAVIDGGPAVVGTLANCSGRATPWGTALSCEENYQDYPVAPPDGYGWDRQIYGRRHYGWLVEVDPFDPTCTPRKHTAMGRFCHQNVAITVSAAGTVVAYMGADRSDSYLYKFVADQPYTGKRTADLTILETGKLYVANFAVGAWLPLDYSSQAILQSATDDTGCPRFASQADVLADTRAAALLLGATALDRPEDIEIHPFDGSVFIALANDCGYGNVHSNVHGQIVRLYERNNQPTAERFEWEIFATGGPESGFSAPDNLIFDGEGNLWLVTDVSRAHLHGGLYSFLGNNEIFFFRTAGPYAGLAFQFTPGRIDSALTSPASTRAGYSLYEAPAQASAASVAPPWVTSHRPDGVAAARQPATVARTGLAGW